MSDKLQHARDNAKGWAESIIALHAESEDASDERREAIEREVQEGPLAVQVRSDWHDPGVGDEQAGEFMILLTTGGPALRIIGELSEHGEPEKARLEMQDWGTRWEEATGIDLDYAALDAALMWYVGHFYFGE